jgi:hypothetical protein
MTLLAGMLLASTTARAETDPAGFEAEQIITWPAVEFHDRTRYALQPAAAAGTGHAAVRADCDAATASGLLHEHRVDLTRTPILEWRWRVDSVYAGLDRHSRHGDDYPARIYVVAQRWPQWRSRVINYVWTGSATAGASWPNPFSTKFVMLAVAGADAPLAVWRTERRNVLEDFRALHGIEADSIDALAIMSDCDNAGQTTSAWYGPIRWLSAP